MTKFLRTTSTKGLLAAGMATVGLMAGGAMMATGAASNGSKPVPKPLAAAIAGSLSAQAEFTGVSARVNFTNRMLDSTGVTAGTDPLMGGGSGRFWADADGRFRIELQSDGGGGDVQIVSDGKQVWLNHGASGQAWKATIPTDMPYRETKSKSSAAKREWPPSISAVAKALKALSGDATISAAQPDNVGGRPAYTVTITPRDTSGLFAGGRISWDAANAAPLAIGILAKGVEQPVLSIRAADVTFGPVDSAVFQLAPPANAKTIDTAGLRSRAGKLKSAKRSAKWEKVTGLDQVQSKVEFRITAPSRIAGRPLREVMLIGRGSNAGALLTYGDGMSAIAVLQMKEDKSAKETGAGNPTGESGGFSIPTERIGGSDAMKLATPLGSLVSLTRDGVRISLAGSVSGEAITAAAADL